MMRSSTTSDAPQTRTPPLSKSLLSKFANSFSSKQRSPVEHEIKLDEPFRHFFAGDTVTGAVVINAPKPFRITHLVIRLHGFVKVVNNARLPGETIPYDENLLTSMRNRRGIEYYGNGFARLFEDEFTLCGDGRLFGKYEFRFELNIPFEGVPSSIDFEHGTISYLLSSTLTRPTAISPTLTCHYKLKVTGNVDVARLRDPKPRTVSLEAVKRTRLRVMRRTTAALSNGSQPSGSIAEGSSVNRGASSSPHTRDIPPQSPVPSVTSSVSAESSSLSASNTVARPIPTTESNVSMENLGSVGLPDKTITAKTELSPGGCLPGDTLHLRISIDHTKAVQTMQGIIVTIFRQGRIDTHPAIPLGPMNSGDRRQYEDYYPRSRTGLGGLSLSSAGSSRAFRQDLAQTITPLIVDPCSLTAVVRTSIQMPDHVFPTITSVPGDMISFKYYVEVVIDLRGKLASQDRFLPNFSIIDGPQHGYGDPQIRKVEGVQGVSYSTTPGFNYLITDQIRRTKGIVFTTSEIVVGTRNSALARGKQKETSNNIAPLDVWSHFPSEEETYSAGAYPDTIAPLGPYDTEQYVDDPAFENSLVPAEDIGIPLPDMEEDLDEKTKIRRAEQRLLPSAAPQDDHTEYAASPSAPFAYDEEDFVQRYGFGAPAPAYEASPSSSGDQLRHANVTSGPLAADGETVFSMSSNILGRDHGVQEVPPSEASTVRPLSNSSDGTQITQVKKSASLRHQDIPSANELLEETETSTPNENESASKLEPNKVELEPHTSHGFIGTSPDDEGIVLAGAALNSGQAGATFSSMQSGSGQSNKLKGADPIPEHPG